MLVLIVLDEVLITHLEHFVDHTVCLLCNLAVADQDLSSFEAAVEERGIIIFLDSIKLLDDFDNFLEAEIYQLLALCLELFTSEEDLVITFDVGYSVR